MPSQSALDWAETQTEISPGAIPRGRTRSIHMKNRKLITILSVVLAVVLIAGVSVYAATNYGTSSDPLITLSYLDKTLTPSVLEQFASELEAALAGQGGGKAETYHVVTLSKGQILTGSVGCEIMLRIGSAGVSASDSPGLVDITSASSLNNGASLSVNHLYMVTIAGNGIKATASTVKVLVRGSYTIS